MDDKRKQETLQDVERVLGDVRGHLDQNQGEKYELRALQLLLEVTKALHSQRDVTSLITLVLDSALSFTEADRAFLMMMDQNGEPRFKMGRSYDREYLKPEDFVISQSVVQETLEVMKPVILADAQSDDQFAARQSIVDLHLRTVMAAPLRHEDRVLGLLYLDSKRPMARYSKHHLNVITSLAEQAGVALHNVRKFDTHTG